MSEQGEVPNEHLTEEEREDKRVRDIEHQLDELYRTNKKFFEEYYKKTGRTALVPVAFEDDKNALATLTLRFDGTVRVHLRDMASYVYNLYSRSVNETADDVEWTDIKDPNKKIFVKKVTSNKLGPISFFSTQPNSERLRSLATVLKHESVSGLQSVTAQSVSENFNKGVLQLYKEMQGPSNPAPSK